MEGQTINDKESLKLFVVLCRTFSSVSGVVKKDIKNYGLSLSEFETLELLYHKGTQTIQEIGKKVLLTSGSMTYVVDQLVKKGLVTRKICENDRRVTYVEIGEKGVELMDEIFPHHSHCISELFSALSTAEIIDMTEKLKRISKSIVIGDKT